MEITSDLNSLNDRAIRCASDLVAAGRIKYSYIHLKINNMLKTGIIFLIILGYVFIYGCSPKYPDFEEKILDSKIVKDCWTKTTGDLNADGVNDLVVGGHAAGGIWAYYSPDLKKQQITDMTGASTDAEVADIDNDGDNDLVAVFDKEILWFENPLWKVHVINDTLVAHDIIVADFDGDHWIDIAARNQGEFGYSGAKIFMLKHLGTDNWSCSEIQIRDGEGLEGADLNKDNKTDIVINGSWFENSGDILHWKEHIFTDTWVGKNAFISCIDINMDGKTDILMSPSELAGSTYRISWFESPADVNDKWKEHIVVPEIETVVHFVGGADFNEDGKPDIVYARMTQGSDPDEVAILYNTGTDKWEKRIISTGGSHSMRITDIDNDNDQDLFGANWNDSIVKIWINKQN